MLFLTETIYASFRNRSFPTPQKKPNQDLRKPSVMCSGVIYYPAFILGQAHSKSNSPYSLFKSNEHSSFILRQDMKILCKTASQDTLPHHVICLNNFAKVHKRTYRNMLKSMSEVLNKPAAWKSYNIFLRRILELSSCRLVGGKKCPIDLADMFLFCHSQRKWSQGTQNGLFWMRAAVVATLCFFVISNCC